MTDLLVAGLLTGAFRTDTYLAEAAQAVEEVNVGTLAQYGVLGVFAAILVVFAKTAYRRETDRADRLEAEVQRLNALIQDRVIGVISSATNAVEESTELMTVMAREQIAAGHRERLTSRREEPLL